MSQEVVYKIARKDGRFFTGFPFQKGSYYNEYNEYEGRPLPSDFFHEENAKLYKSERFLKMDVRKIAKSAMTGSFLENYSILSYTLTPVENELVNELVISAEQIQSVSQFCSTLKDRYLKDAYLKLCLDKGLHTYPLVMRIGFTASHQFMDVVQRLVQSGYKKGKDFETQTGYHFFFKQEPAFNYARLISSDHKIKYQGDIRDKSFHIDPKDPGF